MDQRYEIQAKGLDTPYQWMPIVRSNGKLTIATPMQKLGDPLTQQEASQLIEMCKVTGGYFYRVQQQQELTQ